MSHRGEKILQKIIINYTLFCGFGCLTFSADAIVSSGLAALGYEYVNLGKLS